MVGERAGSTHVEWYASYVCHAPGVLTQGVQRTLADMHLTGMCLCVYCRCGPAMGYKVGNMPDVNQPANILEEIVWYKAKEIEAFREKQPLPLLQVNTQGALSRLLSHALNASFIHSLTHSLIHWPRLTGFSYGAAQGGCEGPPCWVR